MTEIMRFIAVATLLAALLGAQPALAEGDPESGKEIGYTCLGCHGIEGYRNMYPSYRVPKLGGQKAAYLVVALTGYRSGMREHPTMVAQAQSLSDQEIEDVAAYLATLGAETVEAGGGEAPAFDKAATCTACHGPNGIGASPVWPTLAGQHEDYIVHALNQYRDGTRKDPIMAPMAAPLTDADVKQLAAYFSGLKGLQTTLPE
jgi:cytochrome c553